MEEVRKRAESRLTLTWWLGGWAQGADGMPTASEPQHQGVGSVPAVDPTPAPTLLSGVACCESPQHGRPSSRQLLPYFEFLQQRLSCRVSLRCHGVKVEGTKGVWPGQAFGPQSGDTPRRKQRTWIAMCLLPGSAADN